MGKKHGRKKEVAARAVPDSSEEEMDREGGRRLADSSEEEAEQKRRRAIAIRRRPGTMHGPEQVEEGAAAVKEAEEVGRGAVPCTQLRRRAYKHAS